MDGPSPQRWDRGKWITVFSSHSPTIREVTECLGLGLSPSASTTNRGIPKFDAPEFKKLSSEVTRISKELPQDRDALLDFAADPHGLDEELDELLASLGPAIWGKDADRTRLITPDPSKKTYYKDFFYEDPDDRDIIKIHLQRWIVIKACYYIRNRKLKKPSIGEEYESLADIDTGSPATALKLELVSPSATPQSGTPPERAETPSDDTEQLVNLRKRKSSTFQFGSDGENNDTASGSVKKRAYQTFSIQRKSPRISLAAAKFSPENVPPVPSLRDRLEPAASSTVSPNGTRSGLSPLSSSALNGVARPSDSPASSFSVVNGSGPSKPADSTPGPFAAGNAPLGAKPVEAITSAFAAVNTAGITRPVDAPSNTFPAVNVSGPPTPADVPPSTLPAVNGESRTAAASPGSFSVINTQNTTKPQEAPSSGIAAATAPSGFTAVNSLGSSSNSVAPSPRGYTSLYEPPNPHQQHSTTNGKTGHHDTTTHNTPPVQREPTHQKTQNTRHTSDSHSTPQAQGHAPTHAAIAPHPGFGVQPTFHSHNVPNASTPTSSASRFQPAIHTHALTNGSGAANAHVLPSNASTAPPTNGYHYPERQSISRAVSPSDTTLLQCELLGLLIHYLFPRERPRLDEKILLANLEYIWNMNVDSFRRIMGSFYETQKSVLFAWIEERSKIVQLQHAVESQPGLSPLEMVDRLLAMNDLRVMRLKWKLMKAQDGHQVLSSEDLLCRTFATMTKTEGTEKLFREGLEKLNDTMFSFLRTDDMKISMSSQG